jgi:hypothetical protein
MLGPLITDGKTHENVHVQSFFFLPSSPLWWKVVQAPHSRVWGLAHVGSRENEKAKLPGERGPMNFSVSSRIACFSSYVRAWEGFVPVCMCWCSRKQSVLVKFPHRTLSTLNAWAKSHANFQINRNIGASPVGQRDHRNEVFDVSKNRRIGCSRVVSLAGNSHRL